MTKKRKTTNSMAFTLLKILTVVLCTGSGITNSIAGRSEPDPAHVDVSVVIAIDAGDDPGRKSPPGQFKVDITDITYTGPYKGEVGPFRYIVANVPGEDAAEVGACIIALYTNEIVYTGGCIRERIGDLTKVMAGDLDHDGKQELILCLHSGAWAWGSVEIYRISDKGKPTRIALSEEFCFKGKGHRGHDVFSVSNGILYAEYPVYLKDDGIMEPTGGSARYRLVLPLGKWVEVSD